jgi:hypothetical protein
LLIWPHPSCSPFFFNQQSAFDNQQLQHHQYPTPKEVMAEIEKMLNAER